MPVVLLMDNMRFPDASHALWAELDYRSHCKRTQKRISYDVNKSERTRTVYSQNATFSGRI